MNVDDDETSQHHDLVRIWELVRISQIWHCSVYLKCTV